jgi:uncharacterized protein (DUF305 family)
VPSPPQRTFPRTMFMTTSPIRWQSRPHTGRGSLFASLLGIASLATLALSPGILLAQTTGTGGTPPTVRPGAPGAPAARLSAEEASRVTLPRHTAEDVRFMQDMIHHHMQAVEMASLVAERTENADLHLLARKIEASQADELLVMRNWLLARGEEAPGAPPADDPHAGHAGHGAVAATATGHEGHEGHTGHDAMPGMLSEAQLETLRAARDRDFDRLFLEFMIFHHLGAIEMVEALFASPGGGQEGEVYQFAAHVDSDQKIEIERMRRLLATLDRAPDGR